MSEKSSFKLNPGDMAKRLARKNTASIGRIAFTERQIAPAINEEQSSDPDSKLPETGGVYIEKDGRAYRFMPVFKHVRDARTGGYIPKQYTLKEYFAHTGEDGQNGPGWDTRMSILNLSEEEMKKRYGHVFTTDEVMAPMGTRDLETGVLEGGMPSDILYYKVVTQEEYDYLKDK